MKSSAKLKAVSEISGTHSHSASIACWQRRRSQLLGNELKIWQRLARGWVLLLPMALLACTTNVAEQKSEPQAVVSSAEVKPVAELVEQSAIAKSTPKESYSLLINRRDRRLEVFSGEGVRVYEAPVGIGQGGLKEKQNMADLVTPRGEMTVDLILYKKSDYNQIVSQNVERFAQNAQFRPLVNQQGLVQLFNNMNRLDFDGNGSPDRAYGDGYIGLTSETVVTGPKMSTFDQTPYWFSIALHGTPDPQNIGQANSGGCVHLSSETLKQLIENGWVRLGTVVKIID